MTEASQPLPFRRDLKLFPGPREPNGFPTHNLYDPVKGRYFKLSWAEALIYKAAREGMTYEEIASEVHRYSTVRLEVEDIRSFYQQAAYLGLLNLPHSSVDIYREYERSKGSWLWWLVMHYLYIRLPLFQPDRFLGATWPIARLFWTKPAVIFYLLCTLAGVLFVISRWDEYVHSFSYFFNFEGLFVYSLAVFGVKIIHELAHAYTAKRYGIYVPTMGIALIVLWPVLYTDVTEGWKLPRRGQRLAISLAGIVAELTIAGVATLFWALTPPGKLQSVFFILSSATWISSLFLNLNPAMRFDGYYILCDLWGIDNLRPRAFAVARWKMHSWLFGLKVPPPEDDLSRQRILGMVFYSLFSWIYLLILYTAIALFVYHQFAKALGILLFILEVAIFFVWPVVWEVQEVLKLRRYFYWNVNLVVTILLFSVLVMWLVLPLPHSTHWAAITVPDKEQIVYVPYEGQISGIYIKRGDAVKPGQRLVQLTQQAMDTEIQSVEEDRHILKETLRLFSTRSEYQPFIGAKERELEATQEKLSGLLKKREKMTLVAVLPGVVYEWDDTLKDGQYLEKNQVLGKLADTQRTNVLAYIPEHDIRAVEIGKKVRFLLGDGQSVEGEIAAIQTSRATLLDYPVLASRFKGPLPVIVTPEKRFRLTESYFVAKIVLEKPLPYGKSGQVIVQGPPRSLMWEGLSYLWGLLLQESSI